MNKINILWCKLLKKLILWVKTIKNLFFALEPEAASYYCLKMVSMNDNLLNDSSYIVCDLRRETGDIVCYEKKL